ncbi:unannotated protein [freshwater metagenome]|uniref:Unannotated protein n=2 Tax=freshwater metagenome TaxID=449393 RepID=A0A6J6STT1_9ZZZZ|nr:hypothetical protein [Actinomycetota bacterium]MSY78833.1 hypothetical protein [Actinomycetota bacterium]
MALPDPTPHELSDVEASETDSPTPAVSAEGVSTARDAGSHVHVDPGASSAAMDDLRSARRRRRIGDVAWGDLAYRVYTTALACLVFAVFASGWVGDTELSAASVSSVRDSGPAWAGLFAALCVLLGVRSGTRAGPIALESADVYHLLLAPISRTRVLRRPVVGVVGYGVATAMAVGALVGSLCSQRLPGNTFEWMLSGALFGGAAAALALGAALITASRRIPRPWTELLAWALLIASVVAVAGYLPYAPLTLLGQILFWPLSFSPLPLLVVAVALSMAAIGMMTIGGLSIELAQRRTRLVGQLRFAVTQQDLRSVLLLRKQLASERPRNSSRFSRVPIRFGGRFPVFTRDVQSFGRWPWVRVLRVTVLGLGAALCLYGAWSGTTPLVLLAGLCTYVAGLDVIEPLAQEVDHPMMLASYPEPAGVILQRHLVAPVLVMVLVGCEGLLLVWALHPSVNVLAIGAITVVTAAATAVAGASISVVSEAVLDAGDAAMMPPEVTGPRVVIRTLWPPLVAVIGVTPVLLAQRAMRLGNDPIPPALTLAIPVLVLAGLVFMWVKYREDIHRTMGEAMGAKT